MKDLLKRLITNDIPFCPGIYTFLNPFSYYQLRKLKGILNNFDGVGIDGITMVFLLRFLGLSNIKRSSFDFTSQAPVFLNNCQEKHKTVCLVGSTETSITKAAIIIKKKYPLINIKFCRNGYFESDAVRDDFYGKIIEEKVDVVICGMGTPKQEQFLIGLKGKGWDGIGITCGGFFHQIAQKGTQYYPSLINIIHLRWLYRMYKEPYLIKRYIKLYPIGLFSILKDLTLVKKNE